MEESENWLKQAEADLRTSENSLKSQDFYASVFWSQQSAEKALKSFIINNEGKLIKIHDLVILGRRARLPEDLLLKCEKLSLAYTNTRYGISENEIPSKKFKENDAVNFLNIAKGVLEWLRKKI